MGFSVSCLLTTALRWVSDADSLGGRLIFMNERTELGLPEKAEDPTF